MVGTKSHARLGGDHLEKGSARFSVKKSGRLRGSNCSSSGQSGLVVDERLTADLIKGRPGCVDLIDVKEKGRLEA